MTDKPKIPPVPARPLSLRGADKEPVKEDGATLRFDWHPGSVSQVVSLMQGDKRVESIIGRVTTASTAQGPTTLVFVRVPKGIPLPEGKAMHTGSVDLIGGALSDPNDIDQTMAMLPEVCNLEDGDCIAAIFSGYMTNARGTVTIKVVER